MSNKLWQSRKKSRHIPERVCSATKVNPCATAKDLESGSVRQGLTISKLYTFLHQHRFPSAPYTFCPEITRSLVSGSTRSQESGAAGYDDRASPFNWLATSYTTKPDSQFPASTSDAHSSDRASEKAQLISLIADLKSAFPGRRNIKRSQTKRAEIAAAYEHSFAVKDRERTGRQMIDKIEEWYGRLSDVMRDIRKSDGVDADEGFAASAVGEWRGKESQMSTAELEALSEWYKEPGNKQWSNSLLNYISQALIAGQSGSTPKGELTDGPVSVTRSMKDLEGEKSMKTDDGKPIYGLVFDWQPRMDERGYNVSVDDGKGDRADGEAGSDTVEEGGREVRDVVSRVVDWVLDEDDISKNDIGTMIMG